MNRAKMKKYPTEVCLVLRGNDLRPEFWTDYFGVKPDFCARKGERARTPKGKLKDTPQIWGVWNFCSKSPNIKTIDDGVKLLIKALNVPRADFKETLRTEGCEAILSVFVDNGDGTTPPIEGQMTKAFLESTGAELSLTVVDPD